MSVFRSSTDEQNEADGAITDRLCLHQFTSGPSFLQIYETQSPAARLWRRRAWKRARCWFCGVYEPGAQFWLVSGLIGQGIYKACMLTTLAGMRPSRNISRSITGCLVVLPAVRCARCESCVDYFLSQL